MDQMFDLPSQHVYDAEIKGGRFELYFVAHDFGPFVSSRIDPTDEIEMVYVVESAEVRAPFCGMDGDETVVWTFFIEYDGVRVFPRVDEAWLVSCTPAKVFYAWDVWSVLVEFPHVFESEEVESFTVTTSYGEEVEEGEKLG